MSKPVNWDDYKLPPVPVEAVPGRAAVPAQEPIPNVEPAVAEKLEEVGRKDASDRARPEASKPVKPAIPKKTKQVFTGGTEFKLERLDGTPIDVDLPGTPALRDDPDRPTTGFVQSPATVDVMKTGQLEAAKPVTATAYGSPALAERAAAQVDVEEAKKKAAPQVSPAVAEKVGREAAPRQESPATLRMREEKYYASPAQITGFAVREAGEKLTGKDLDIEELIHKLEGESRLFIQQRGGAGPDVSLTSLDAQRKKMVDDVVQAHAARFGTNRRALEMEAASRGIPLAAMIEGGYEAPEMDMAAPAAEVIDAVKKRGVDLEARSRVGNIDINWSSFSPQMWESETTTGVMGTAELPHDVEVVKPGERGYETALQVWNAVEDDGYNVGYITKLAGERGGATKWVQQRVEELSAGVNSADPDYDAKKMRAWNRAVAEIAAFKTIGLWASPIFMNDLIAPDYSATLTDRLASAVKGQREVVGYGPTTDDNKPRIITRAKSTPATFLDFVDIPQQAVVGFAEEVAEKGWDQADFAEGAVKGIEDRRDAMTAALASDWAKPTQVYDNFGQLKLDENGQPVMEGTWKPVVAGGLGFAVSVLFPDMTLYAGKIGSAGGDAYKGLRDARRMSEVNNLLEGVIAARVAGATALRDAEKAKADFRAAVARNAPEPELNRLRAAESESRQVSRAIFDSAAEQEAKLRGKYKMVADDVDRMDGQAIQDLARDNPDVFNENLARAASHSDELVTMHPSLRRMKTKGEVVSDIRAKKPAEVSFVDYDQLFNTGKVVRTIDEVLGDAVSAEVVTKVLRTTASNDVVAIARVAGDDDIAKALVADIENTLGDAVADPKAWANGILDRRNQLPSINPADDATDAVKAAAKEKRAKLVRSIVSIYSKAKAAAKDAATDIRGRAIEAALTNNESRIAAASIMKERLGSMRQSRKSRLKNIGSDSTLEMAMEKADYEPNLTTGGVAFKKMLVDAGLPEKQAQVAAIITDARARVASWKRGISTDEWYATRIEGVLKGDARGFTADALYQEKLAENVDVSRLAVPEGFFSPLQRAIAKVIGDNNGKPVKSGYLLQQVKKQSGVKADELAWSGLEEFLAGKERVSLDEVTDWLTKREPVVEVKGVSNNTAAADKVKAIGNRLAEIDRELSALKNTEAPAVEKLLLESPVAEDYKKFKKAFQLTPDKGINEVASYHISVSANDGEYVENDWQKPMFDWLATDEKARQQVVGYRQATGRLDKEANGLRNELFEAKNENDVVHDSYVAPGASTNYREIRAVQPAVPNAGGQQTMHFEPNAIYHLRTTDRVTEDGKKVLFVEEVQSDWHQAGAKKGYAGTTTVPESLDSFYSEKNFPGDPPGAAAARRGVEETLTDLQASLKGSGRQLQPTTAMVATQPQTFRPIVLARDDSGRWHAVQRDFGGMKGTIRTVTGASATESATAYARRYPSTNLPLPGAHADTWRELALKQALIIAAREGYDGVALTRGPIIARVAGGSGVGGELSGQLSFYEELLPGTAASLAKKNGSRMETAKLKLGVVVDDEKVKELRAAYKRLDDAEDKLKVLREKQLASPEYHAEYARNPDRKMPDEEYSLVNARTEASAAIDRLEGKSVIDPEDMADVLVAGDMSKLQTPATAWRKADDGVSNVPFIPVTDAMKAKVESEGLPLFSRDTVNTPAFKKWFGDSKVVDESGKPLVVYHGTYGTTKGDDFDAFKPGVTYLTDNASLAAKHGDRVMPLYVRAENTVTLPDEDFRQLMDKPELVARLKAKGYDSAKSDDPTSGMTVFAPEQVKSVHNSGAFSPDDARLLYSKDASTAARLLEANGRATTLKAEVDDLTTRLAAAKKRGETLKATLAATKGSKISPDSLRSATIRLRAEIEAVKGDVEALTESLKAKKAAHAEASKAATLAKKADDAAEKVVVKADKKGESVPVTQARARLTAARKEYNAAARQLSDAKIALADAVSAKAKPAEVKALKSRVEAAVLLERQKGDALEGVNALLMKTLASDGKTAAPVSAVAAAKPVPPSTAASATSPLPAAHGTPMGGVVPAVAVDVTKQPGVGEGFATEVDLGGADEVKRLLAEKKIILSRRVGKTNVYKVLDKEALKVTAPPVAVNTSNAAGAPTLPASGLPTAEDYENLYQDAVDFISKEGKASASMIQRQFKIGYNRAGDMIERMEKEGVIGPVDAAKPREVFGRQTPRPATAVPTAVVEEVADTAADASKAAPTPLDASTPSPETVAKVEQPPASSGPAVDMSRVDPPNAGPNLPRGAVTFADDGRAIIHAFEGANVETFLHEVGHIMRRDLDADEVGDVVDWLRAQTGDAGLDIVDGRLIAADATTAEELFAEGFTAYLRTGVSPTPNLQRAFDYLKSWLREIYKTVRGFFPQSVTPETAKMFDKLLSIDKSDEAIAKAMRSGIDPKATPGIIKRAYREMIGPALPQAPKTMDELAKAAQASGIDTTAEKLEAIMARDGKIDFPTPVAGRASYTDDDLKRFQATIERARTKAREEVRLKQALSSPNEAVTENSPTEALRNRVSGDGDGSRVARFATSLFIGLDADLDLRAMPAHLRAFVKVGARNVEAAYSDGVKLLAERAPDKFRQWLAGRPTKFENGRNAISSGHDMAGAVRMNTRLAFSTLGDKAREGAERAAFSISSESVARLGVDSRELVSKAVVEVLYATNSDFLKQLGEVLDIPGRNAGIGVVTEPRPQEVRLTGALQRFAHVDSDSLLAVDDFLDILEDIYGSDKAARVGLLIAGHGAGHKTIQKWYNAGLTVSPKEAMVFQSWLHAEKMSPEDFKKAQATAEKFGLDPRFVPVSGQFGTIHVPEAARKRLAAAMAKPTQDSLNWLSSPNDIGRGIYKDNVKPGQAAYDAVGFLTRGLKAGMTRGNLLVSSWFNFANLIDRSVQVSIKAGLGAAFAVSTRVMAQDLLIFAPFVSRAADVGRRFKVFGPEVIENMRRELSRGGDRMSVLIQKMALANTCSISTNKVLDGVDETVNLGGRWYNYKDLRQVYIDQGVSSSYAGELDNAIRKSLEPPASLAEKLGDRLASYMEYVEEMHEGLAERERVGAMITFIEMGAAPEDAARLAVAALFDYGSSIAAPERSAFLAIFFPFWAFQKNANVFTIDSLLSPWGAYRVGVVRRMWEGSTEALSEVLYGSVADPYGMDTRALSDTGRANYYALRAELEAMYGGSEHVPDDIKLALRHLFGQLPAYMMTDGKISELSAKMQSAVDMSAQPDFRMDPLTGRPGMLDIAEAYVPRPNQATGASYNRERPVITMTYPKTEAMKRYLALANDDHPFTELMLPENTIVAGLRHVLNLGAATILLPQKLAAWASGKVGDDLGQDPEWFGIDETRIAGPLTQVMDPDRSLLLPEISADLLGGAEAPPYRIHPFLGKTFEAAGLPLMTVGAQYDPFGLSTGATPEAEAENARLMGNPTWRGRDSTDKNIAVISEKRYYTPGGLWSIACKRTPGFHDLNRLLLATDQTTLEEAGGLRGDLMWAASAILNAPVAENLGDKSAAREEPRKKDEVLNPNK